MDSGLSFPHLTDSIAAVSNVETNLVNKLPNGSIEYIQDQAAASLDAVHVKINSPNTADLTASFSVLKRLEDYAKKIVVSSFDFSKSIPAADEIEITIFGAGLANQSLCT